MLTTTDLAKRCGWTREWAWAKARDGLFDEFKLPGWSGKHYRFEDSPELRDECAAIKAGRERARHPKLKATATMAGVSTWNGLAMQFDLMQRQIGDKWKTWGPQEIDHVLGKLGPTLKFASRLQHKLITRQKAE